MLTLDKNEVLGRAQLKGIDTAGELADRLGISPQWMYQLLGGNAEPSTKLLVKLTNLLDCSIDSIAVYPKDAAPIVVA